MSETSQSVVTTGLAWGLRASFRRYVRGVAHGVETLDADAGSLPDGRFYFPLAEVRALDPGAGEAGLAFAGGVHFGGHLGMIDLTVGGLDLSLTGGTGSVTSFGRPLVDVALAATAEHEGVVTLVLASRLAAGGEPLFDGVYEAQTPFDDLEVRVPAR